MEDLQRFAGDPGALHVPAWRWFNERDDGGLAFWSELYVIEPEQYETFFRNVEGVGLSRFGQMVPMEAHERQLGLAGSVGASEEAVVADGRT
jgi:hypothetical protein